MPVEKQQRPRPERNARLVRSKRHTRNHHTCATQSGLIHKPNRIKTQETQPNAMHQKCTTRYTTNNGGMISSTQKICIAVCRLFRSPPSAGRTGSHAGSNHTRKLCAYVTHVLTCSFCTILSHDLLHKTKTYTPQNRAKDAREHHRGRPPPVSETMRIRRVAA